VRQVIDDASEPVLTQTFDPYGSPYAHTGAVDTSWGFAGEQTDDNGLIYLRTRYYNPQQGRFLNTDPSRKEMNPYRYSNSNPVMFIDPSGLYSGGTCDEVCDIMRNELKPLIISAAERFNLPVFTNMTDEGFAAMLGAKLLFEKGVKPVEGFTWQYHLEGAIDWLGGLDPWLFGSLMKNKDLSNDVPPEMSGVSYGRTNVYVQQSVDAQDWWDALGSHLNEYEIQDLDYSSYNTNYLSMRNEGIANPEFYEPVSLNNTQTGLERQALVMVHAGFMNYEGVAGTPANLNSLCWGSLAGLQTNEISAFRIAITVIGGYGQLVDDNWRNTGYSGPIPRASAWVNMIPIAAEMLELSVDHERDFLAYSDRDVDKLSNELGYSPAGLGYDRFIIGLDG